VRLSRSLALSAALLLTVVGGLPARADEAIGEAQPGDRPTPGSDEAELWYAMERAELDLQKSPQLVRDPALNKYVHDVACRVTGDYCKDLRVYIMDVPYFNASMAPNGALIIWSGALLRMQNEADLALVLGHEFGHYRERHTLQQWRKLKKSSGFISAFSVLTYGVGFGLAGMAADLVGAASLLKFSRDKEREADKIGFAQLVAQGYDPNSGVHLWEAMLREENARDYGKPIPVFASHPETRERLEDLRAAAAAIPNPGKETGLDRYRAATAPFLKHWLDGELSRRMYTTSVQVIGDLRQTCAPNEKGLYTFYLGEAHHRRNKGDDRSQADALYAEAIDEPGAPPEAWREHGMSLRAAGNKPEARIALQHYLELAPNADDRAFVLSYIDELKAGS
jgi:predicted Zn-dependent protease